MSLAQTMPMSRRRPLEAVFLTRCSVPCFQVTPAVAQLADDLDLRLTLLHAFDPERERRRDVETRLRSFFPRPIPSATAAVWPAKGACGMPCSAWPASSRSIS